MRKCNSGSTLFSYGKLHILCTFLFVNQIKTLTLLNIYAETNVERNTNLNSLFINMYRNKDLYCKNKMNLGHIMYINSEILYISHRVIFVTNQINIIQAF